MMLFCYKNKEERRKSALLKDMRCALVRREFFVVYQPQISCQTGRVCGWEALVRWQHPKRGIISPADFIPVAESSGLIVPLGLFVLEESLKQLAAWRKMGYQNLTMAVNVSPAQFDDEGLFKAVCALLRKYRIEPKMLEIELTENLLMKDEANALKMMQKFVTKGVRLAIDDFGTGYSALNYLRLFPFNRLKIDRSFIQNMMTNKKDSTLILGIITLGHILGLNVIAEGVEKSSQLTKLKKMGCDDIQGFYIAKPLDTTTATSFLIKKNQA